MKALLILFVAGAMLTTSIVKAEMYQWPDEDGAQVYKYYPPPQEKPRETKKATHKQQKKTQPRPSSYQQSYQPSYPSTRNAQNNHVELYVTRWCGYCRQAEDLLRSYGIPFSKYDIERDPAALERKNKLDGRQGVPFALINGKPVHGFSREHYLKYLNLAQKSGGGVPSWTRKWSSSKNSLHGWWNGMRR